jgi:hypothetical protein
MYKCSIGIVFETVKTSNRNEFKQTMESETASTYSFAAWIASILIYICFIAWAFLPENLLHSIGVFYYPSRYYAIAIPAYFMVLYILINVAYMGLNLFYTLNPEELGTMRDTNINDRNDNSATAVPLQFFKIKCGTNEGIPDMGDIDPVLISFVYCKKDK